MEYNFHIHTCIRTHNTLAKILHIKKKKKKKKNLIRISTTLNSESSCKYLYILKLKKKNYEREKQNVVWCLHAIPYSRNPSCFRSAFAHTHLLMV